MYKWLTCSWCYKCGRSFTTHPMAWYVKHAERWLEQRCNSDCVLSTRCQMYLLAASASMFDHQACRSIQYKALMSLSFSSSFPQCESTWSSTDQALHYGSRFSIVLQLGQLTRTSLKQLVLATDMDWKTLQQSLK